MDGKACTLWAGVGECCIEERRMEPDGTWRVVGRVDVRGRQTVEIEGSDPVKIARGKLKSEWPERRGELLALLAAAGR